MLEAKMVCKACGEPVGLKQLADASRVPYWLMVEISGDREGLLHQNFCKPKPGLTKRAPIHGPFLPFGKKRAR